MLFEKWRRKRTLRRLLALHEEEFRKLVVEEAHMNKILKLTPGIKYKGTFNEKYCKNMEQQRVVRLRCQKIEKRRRDV